VSFVTLELTDIGYISGTADQIGEPMTERQQLRLVTIDFNIPTGEPR
jgi:hypothetical protein